MIPDRQDISNFIASGTRRGEKKSHLLAGYCTETDGRLTGCSPFVFLGGHEVRRAMDNNAVSSDGARPKAECGDEEDDYTNQATNSEESKHTTGHKKTSPRTY